MGETRLTDGRAGDGQTVYRITLSDGRPDGMEGRDGRVFGSYLHGLFDKAWTLAGNRKTESPEEYKERQYDKLADLVRNSLDMNKIYEILGMPAPGAKKEKTEEALQEG